MNTSIIELLLICITMFLHKIINYIHNLCNISHLVKVKINNYITFILDKTFINTYVNDIKYSNSINKKIITPLFHKGPLGFIYEPK